MIEGKLWEMSKDPMSVQVMCNEAEPPQYLLNDESGVFLSVDHYRLDIEVLKLEDRGCFLVNLLLLKRHWRRIEDLREKKSSLRKNWQAGLHKITLT